MWRKQKNWSDEKVESSHEEKIEEPKVDEKVDADEFRRLNLK